MKKIVSYFIGMIMIVGMLFTLGFGYAEIGSKILDGFDNSAKYEGLKKIDNFFQSVESGWNDGLFMRNHAVDVYGLVQRIQGKNIIVDSDSSKTVLKGSDGKLYFNGNVTGDTDSSMVLENTKKLAEISEYCGAKNIDFLFAIAPAKYNSKQVTLPMECSDYMELTKSFSQELDKLQVANINLMSEWNEEAEVYSDGFFATDHHWNIETAFWGFQQIVSKLNEMSTVKIPKEYYSKENYDVEIEKSSFLGSMGARTGGWYVGKDDFALISPNYDTDFSVHIETDGHINPIIERQGDYDESIVVKGSGYGQYISSDVPFIHVNNKLNDNGKKVLLVKDSFAVPVSAWLACGVDELVVLDLRYSQEKSVYEYMDEYHIDTVLTLYNPEMLGVAGLFEFYEATQ